MPEKKINHPSQNIVKPRIAKYGFVWLLLALLLMWILSPFLENVETHQHVLSFLLTLVTLVAAWAVSPARRSRWVALLLALASAGLFWMGAVGVYPKASVFARIVLFVYYGYIIVMILRHIVAAREIDLNVLCGAAAVFILIGVAWAISYWAISDMDPKAFTPPDRSVIPVVKFHHYLYFSLVTLTSLGYGDITPASHFAQMWTTLEAVCGTFYLAILVARLVSLYRR
ncbi:MAG: hypothetical protein JJV98_15705 [Desulfosarcina sp.]|nr:hypothetical protein [Desulfobacterales bacterium]